MALATSAALGITLEQAALTQFAAAVAAGCPLEVNSSYRDPALQERLFLANYVTAADTQVRRATPLDRRYWSGHGWYERRRIATTGATSVSVAVPGTSRHESGLAIDLGPNAQRWMKTHGASVGFINPDWAQQVATFEPWHWEFDPTLITPTEDDMPISETEWTRLESTIEAKATAAVVKVLKAIADRDSTWARATSDAAYDASRAVHNRELQAMADGTDAGGRLMRDRLRTIVTGSTATAATSTEVATIASALADHSTASIGTPVSMVVTLSGTATPTTEGA